MRLCCFVPAVVFCRLAILLPAADAIYLFHSAADHAAGAALAFPLMHRLLVGEVSTAAAAAVTATAAPPSSETLKEVAPAADLSSASSASAFIPPSSAASHHSHPAAVVAVCANANRLGCLAASGEQLEVLVEWYLELCAATNHWQELQDALRDKMRTRAKVQFNQRLSELAKKHLLRPQQA